MLLPRPSGLPGGASLAGWQFSFLVLLPGIQVLAFTNVS
jgi:hypothetical protein